MPVELESKKQAIAQLIDGEVVDDSGRVAVCIRGNVDGYRATMEAVVPGWPFGVIYTVESVAGIDPSAPYTKRAARITLYPRVGRGMAGFFTNILLFESNTMRVDNKDLESVFNFTYDDKEMAQRFCNWPGVSERLLHLENVAKFSEVVIRTDAGIYLSQPKSFNSLDLDLCQQTFESLADIAAILAEHF
jgi:hypothetical protein